MIYDCFTYNGEWDLLKIRCEELKKLPVRHVIVESCFTFTGKQKELKLLNQIDQLKGYNIIPIIVDDMPNNGNAWDNEYFQRNAIMRGLKMAYRDDIIIISDCDEIPKKEAVEEYMRTENGQLAALKMDTYRYYMNCLEGKQNWISPKIMTWGYLKDKTPDEVRNSGFPMTIENAGWHLSYMGGYDKVIEKIESFSHQELNTPEFKAQLKHKIDTCESLFSEDKWTLVPVNHELPLYVQEHQHGSLKHLIKEI